MKLTKYEHACFMVEKDGQALVVDPGNFTNDFVPPEHVVGVVITHEHGDHCDTAQLARIIEANPEVLIIAHPDITSTLSASYQTRAVLPGEHTAVGSFDLDFYGGDHAVIHPDIAPVANIGVLINGLLYYPSDSFVRPDVPVDTLALPVSAPWLKISETIDFLRDVQPRFAFPTHDAILSDTGKSLVDRMIPQFVSDVVYERLAVPIEL